MMQAKHEINNKNPKLHWQDWINMSKGVKVLKILLFAYIFKIVKVFKGVIKNEQFFRRFYSLPWKEKWKLKFQT
jgi:hypothetical protein